MVYHVERSDPIEIEPMRDHAHRLQGYLEYAGSEAQTINLVTFTPQVTSGVVAVKVVVTTSTNHGWSTGATTSLSEAMPCAG